MSETGLIGAVVATLNARFPAGVRAYGLSDVPSKLPATYVEVSAARRHIAEGARVDGSLSQYGYRVLTRLIAQRADNADLLAELVTDALDFVTLIVGTQTTTLSFDAGDAAAPDDGWYSALHTWTCSLTITNPK